MGSPAGRGVLTEGERVLLIDAKSRRYLLTLTAGRAFHTHAGIVQHDDVIGQVEGSSVHGSTGRSFLVLRPTLSDLVLKMPRGAQVIYPKDIGAILLAADIGPGQRVFEAGVGSGALSMAVLRAGASIVGYDLRQDFADRDGQRARGAGRRSRLPDRDPRRHGGHRRTRRRPGAPRPPRALAGGAPRGEGPAARRDHALLSAHHQPDGAAARDPHPRPVRSGRDGGDPASNVAHRGPLGSAGPSDGGAHRVLDHGAPAGGSAGGGGVGQSRSMKMHSPGHSSAASTTASSSSSGTRAMPADPPGSL